MSNFNISSLYNLNSTQIKEMMSNLKNGNADERKLFKFMANKVDADKNGSIDLSEFMRFISKVDKSNAKKTADGEISDAELEKMFGTKKPGLIDAFANLVNNITKTAGQVPDKADKTEDTFKHVLTDFAKRSDINSEDLKFGKVKENNSNPKAKFKGVEYDKSMVMTYKDGTQVVAYCDKSGNIIGYKKIEKDKKGNKTSTSYTADGNKNTVIKYNKDGAKTSQVTYDEEGNKSTVVEYKNGKPSKKMTYATDENGKRFVETEKTFAKNGAAKSVVTYNKDGVMIASGKYDENGKLKTKTFYAYEEDGTRVIKQQDKYTRDGKGNVTKKSYKKDPETGKTYLSSKTSYVIKDGVKRPTKEEIYFPGTKILKEQRKYDKNGLVSEVIKYNNDEGHTTQSTTKYKDGKIVDQMVQVPPSELADPIEPEEAIPNAQVPEQTEPPSIGDPMPPEPGMEQYGPPNIGDPAPPEPEMDPETLV